MDNVVEILPYGSWKTMTWLPYIINIMATYEIMTKAAWQSIIILLTFSALLAICAGNSSVPGEFPAQRPMTRSFDVFFDLRLNKRLSKQSWGWWYEALSRPLWRHCNVLTYFCKIITLSALHWTVFLMARLTEIITTSGHNMAPIR